MKQQQTKAVTAKDRLPLSDDAIGWIGLAIGLIAAFILDDKAGPPYKWHAALMWTFVAFFGVLIFGRKQRSSWQFWILWTGCLILHVVAMWVIFGLLLPRLILGTVYVVPIAFIESIFLLAIILKILRKLPRLAKERI